MDNRHAEGPRHLFETTSLTARLSYCACFFQSNEVSGSAIRPSEQGARLRATNSACWRLQAWLLLPH